MKTKISIAAILVVTVLFLAGCQSSPVASGIMRDKGGNAAATELLTETEAKDIALKDAGFKEGDVTGLRVSLDKDDGRTYYEVDFRKGNVEYDYEIDAVTGKVVKLDKDVND